MENNPVNHPSHYTDGKIEHIKYAFDRGWGEAGCLYNCTKYLHRAGKKDPSKKIEDLEKARFYLDYLINYLKSS